MGRSVQRAVPTSSSYLRMTSTLRRSRRFRLSKGTWPTGSDLRKRLRHLPALLSIEGHDPDRTVPAQPSCQEQRSPTRGFQDLPQARAREIHAGHLARRGRLRDGPVRQVPQRLRQHWPRPHSGGVGRMVRDRRGHAAEPERAGGHVRVGHLPRRCAFGSRPGLRETPGTQGCSFFPVSLRPRPPRARQARPEARGSIRGPAGTPYTLLRRSECLGQARVGPQPIARLVRGKTHRCALSQKAKDDGRGGRDDRWAAQDARTDREARQHLPRPHQRQRLSHGPASSRTWQASRLRGGHKGTFDDPRARSPCGGQQGRDGPEQRLRPDLRRPGGLPASGLRRRPLVRVPARQTEGQRSGLLAYGFRGPQLG